MKSFGICDHRFFFAEQTGAQTQFINNKDVRREDVSEELSCMLLLIRGTGMVCLAPSGCGFHTRHVKRSSARIYNIWGSCGDITR